MPRLTARFKDACVTEEDRSPCWHPVLVREDLSRDIVAELKQHADAMTGAEWMKGERRIGVACCEWLARHKTAVVCCDNIAVEVLPGEIEGEILPVHMILLRDMGMTLGEILDFEELADDCASDGVYEFFFCGPPIKFSRALGSPINPLAMK